MNRPVKKRQIVDLEIVDLAYEGKGIARIGKYCIFVKGGIPGQTVRAFVTKAKISYAEANVTEILQKSPTEIEPRCKYFKHCGGCVYQNLPYDEQLFYLEKQVKDTYQHLGGFSKINFLPIIGSENIYHYRNKMEFSFSPYRWLMPGIDEHKDENFALGLRPNKSYMKTIDIDKCFIAPLESEKIMSIVRKFAIENNLQPHNQKTHQGFLRHLMLRKGYNTDQIMINIITKNDRPELFNGLVKKLAASLPNLPSIVNAVTDTLSGTTKGEKYNLLFGEKYIEEKLGKFRFRISAESFFQTNTYMAEKLYELIKNFSNLERDNIVWDLFCGAGSIAIYLAPFVKKVIGFEIVHQAVEDAKINAKLNGIENVEFIESNLDKYFQKNTEKIKEFPSPDLMILDPPRAGINFQLIREIIQIAPKEIIYVSCKPSTQVRDLKIFTEKGKYRIDAVQPVDMFPHTAHIEVVTKLVKN
ncbi:MAG: 23S rRNA (uracil(1939)-C(5))-methyltransferase RlmD [Candidatus Cloacimonadota bacterium]|nr:23S rRNA (uracil(1939)-C(5))-methyltransferase RlmD [Candidatus Cloacimonadota bacterium]